MLLNFNTLIFLYNVIHIRNAGRWLSHAACVVGFFEVLAKNQSSCISCVSRNSLPLLFHMFWINFCIHMSKTKLEIGTGTQVWLWDELVVTVKLKGMGWYKQVRIWPLKFHLFRCPSHLKKSIPALQNTGPLFYKMERRVFPLEVLFWKSLGRKFKKPPVINFWDLYMVSQCH